MERGIGTGASIEDGPLLGGGPSQRAITEHILWRADRAGYRAALIDAADGSVIPWPRFAQTVRAAARGLGRRGLTQADTVGILVQDAVRYAVAVHAVRAAGASPVPIRLDPDPAAPPAAASAEGTASIAAQLKACGARLLITADALADVATQAADRSWVRQVFAFGDGAESTGATPFGSLLETARHGQQMLSSRLEAAVADITPTDVLELAGVDYPGGLTARLTSRDVVVAGPVCGAGYGYPGYTALIDFALVSGSTIVAAAAAHIADVARAYAGTAAIVARGVRVPGIPEARVFTVD